MGFYKAIDSMKKILSCLIAVQVALAPVVAYPQSPSAQAPQRLETMTPQEIEDMKVSYFLALDHALPQISELALGDPLPNIWKITGNDPLLDENPYFMRSQSWESSSDSASIKQVQPLRAVYAKEGRDLQLSLGGLSQSLRIKEAMSPVLETLEYIILSADNLNIFRSKNPGEAEPGEGLFFIDKKDFVAAAEKKHPVPIYFMPLPDSGWTSLKNNGFELELTDQIVVYNQERDGLPIDRIDFATIAKISRQNLQLAQAWTQIESGGTNPTGFVYPRPNTTISFGTILSGQLPTPGGLFASTQSEVFREHLNKKIAQVAREILPEAHADGQKSVLKKIKDYTLQRASSLWDATKENKAKLATVGTMWGTTLGAAAYLSSEVQWKNLLSATVGNQVMVALGLMGSIFVYSLVAKLTIHKKLFEKKYPSENKPFWTRLNNAHKAVLDEYTWALWTVWGGILQVPRTAVGYAVERFLPNNKFMHNANKVTMGFMSKQASGLPMDHRSFYYGAIIHGMSDSFHTLLCLLIFFPALFMYLDIPLASGAASATAAFVTGEILRNFISYLMSGAHSHAEDTKLINMDDTRRIIRARMSAEGKNPDAAINQKEFERLFKHEMDQRLQAQGAPRQKDFVYDHITVIQNITRWLGFGAHGSHLSDFSRNRLNLEDGFLMKYAHQGSMKPTVERALQVARMAQEKAPSTVGAQTVALLEHYQKKMSVVVAATTAAVKGTVQFGSMHAAVEEEIAKLDAQKQQGEGPQTMAGRAFAFARAISSRVIKYIAVDGTQEVRDLRMVEYLMSNPAGVQANMKYLPESWRKNAGSEAAARAGAELIHRSFFSLYSIDPSLVVPDPSLESVYGDKVDAQLAAEHISDTFTRQLRRWELLHLAKIDAKQTHETATYQPPAQSRTERGTWLRAQAGAKLAAQAAATNTDMATALPIYIGPSRNWPTMAQSYREIVSDKDGNTPPGFSEDEWMQKTQERVRLAISYGKQVGLYIDDPEQSELVRKVTVSAARLTDSQLAQPSEQNYTQTLTESERGFYEGQIFTAHFVSEYINETVKSYDNISAASHQMPGRFQKFRRALVKFPRTEKYVSPLIRGIEGFFFRNQHYGPGFWDKLRRNVPLVPDLAYGLKNDSRRWPFIMIFQFPIYYYLWQIQMPYSTWMFLYFTMFTNFAAHDMNLRLMRYFDIRPLSGTLDKMIHAYVHSSVTNLVFAPIQRYAQPWNETWNHYVTTPIVDTYKNCADYLSSRIHGR